MLKRTTGVLCVAVGLAGICGALGVNAPVDRRRVWKHAGPPVPINSNRGGFSVSGDGRVLAVPSELDPFEQGAGVVQSLSVYRLNSTSQWAGSPETFPTGLEYAVNSQVTSMSSNGGVLVTTVSDPFSARDGTLVFRRDGSSWERVGGLLKEETIDGELFTPGAAAAVSGDGTHVVTSGVGFNWTDSTHSGNITVYRRQGDAWVKKGGHIHQARGACVVPGCVQVSSNGDVVAVAVAGPTGARLSVYRWGDSGWAPMGQWFEWESIFGEWVPFSLSSDGMSVAIADSGCTYTACMKKGVSMVYGFDGDAWVQRGGDIEHPYPAIRHLNKNDLGVGFDDMFSLALSMSGDGNVLAVGAPSLGWNRADTGVVWIFWWNGTGWTPSVSPVRPVRNTSQALFGALLSLSADGSSLAVLSNSEIFTYSIQQDTISSVRHDYYTLVVATPQNESVFFLDSSPDLLVAFAEAAGVSAPLVKITNITRVEVPSARRSDPQLGLEIELAVEIADDDGIGATGQDIEAALDTAGFDASITSNRTVVTDFTDGEEGDGAGLSVGAVVGIIVGALAGVSLVAGMAYYWQGKGQSSLSNSRSTAAALFQGIRIYRKIPTGQDAEELGPPMR